jgi:Acetyltransferase (GNAT) domain
MADAFHLQATWHTLLILDDYIFTDTLPSNIDIGFEVSLFNQRQHRSMQSQTGWHSYFVINNKHKRLEGCVHFHIENSIARSPYKAPFASFEFAETIPLEQRYDFVRFSEDRLRQLGVETIIVKNPLRAYDPSNLALLEVFLLNNGWNVEAAEVGCMIDSRRPVEHLFDSWESRKLRQANDAGLVFKSLPAERLDEAYLFILACRKKKNYSLSMSLTDLRTAFESFPEQYGLYGLYHETELIAASLTVQVTSQVLYHFYTDHDDRFDKLSPVVFLTVQLLKEAVRKNIRYLDLGTSAYEGIPNFGLLNFKVRLGGTPSSKLTFVKSLK